MMNVPLQMMVVALAGWVNERKPTVTEYVTEENRVLRAQPGRKRLRFTGYQRRRLVATGKVSLLTESAEVGAFDPCPSTDLDICPHCRRPGRYDVWGDGP